MRVVVTSVLSVMIAALAWVALSHLAQEISYAEVRAALKTVSMSAMLAALAATAISFLALTFYDRTALAYVGRKVPHAQVSLASFCAYAVGNTVGFGPLTAGAIRYRFYTPFGLEPEDIARVIGFVTAGFGLGLATTTGLGLLGAGSVPGIAVPTLLLQLVGAGLLLLPAVLLGLSTRGAGLRWRRIRIDLPTPGLLVQQLLAAMADIAAAGTVLWFLLPPLDMGWTGFIAVYAVAVGLGVLSHVPAGLGVFETVILAAVGSQAPGGQVLGALLLYRVIYHVVPLILAALVLVLLETRRATALLVSSGLVPPVLAALTLLLSVILVFSGVAPTNDGRLDRLSEWLPLPVLEGAHFLASILGLLLLIAARGLAYRLDGAWWAVIVLLPAAMLLSLAKGLALIETVLLGLLLFALVATRRAFFRRASLLHQTMSTPWIMAIALLLVMAASILFFVYKDVDYAHELWWQFEFASEAPRALRALLGVALLAGTFAGWSLLRPAVMSVEPATGEELDRARNIADAQSQTGAHLAQMGDKSLMFSDDGKAFIMYSRQGRSWIALFDPVGEPGSWAPLVWQFVESARTAGGRAVFYQVAPANLSLYADAGLAAFKLGEEALVPLAGFDLKGSKRAALRHALNKGDREGLIFELLPRDAIPAHIHELRAISDEWLATHNVREKRFSLGAYDPAYLASQPVAVLRLEGRIVTFASLMLTHLKEEASIDLMRFSRDAPAGCMEYLLLRLILHFKEQGYGHFSLGMAPLAGLPDSDAATLWHRVGRTVFDHGDRFYNFTGLRNFKAKFQPVWRPRYMAVAGGLNPMLALTDVTVLIGGGWRGVVAK